MFSKLAAFSGFSVNNIAETKSFYIDKLGLELNSEEMGLRFNLPGGGSVFMYPKDNHEPATFTILNFVVKDIDEAVDSLISSGITFEQYDGLPQDEKGIARGKAANMGPDIAWFKDPSGNIMSVLQND